MGISAVIVVILPISTAPLKASNWQSSRQQQVATGSPVLIFAVPWPFSISLLILMEQSSGSSPLMYRPHSFSDILEVSLGLLFVMQSLY